jgi:hypothetical protein
MSLGGEQDSRLSVGWGLISLLERAAREAFALRNAPPGWSSDLSDLEHMVLLAPPARRLGGAGHVELLLLFGNVSQDRTQALVLDDRGLVHLRPLVEGALGQVDAVVPDRQPPVGVINHRDPFARQ